MSVSGGCINVHVNADLTGNNSDVKIVLQEACGSRIASSKPSTLCVTFSNLLGIALSLTGFDQATAPELTTVVPCRVALGFLSQVHIILYCHSIVEHCVK